MVACQVNLDVPGNQGLVATCKSQLPQKSVMLYHFLVNLLKTTKMTHFRMAQEEYTYVQDGNPSIQHFCGLILWAMIREEMMKVSTKDLKTQLDEVTLLCATPASLSLSPKCCTLIAKLKQKRVISTIPTTS